MKLGSARCPFLAATSISVSFNISRGSDSNQAVVWWILQRPSGRSARPGHPCYNNVDVAFPDSYSV